MKIWKHQNCSSRSIRKNTL